MRETICTIHYSNLLIHKKYSKGMKYMLEVRHLHYFKAVAEHLNFTKAAQSVNMSQPPLSYQIKQLEKYLGVDLFYRTNRSVKLTKAGKYFYDVTVKTLNNFESQVEMVIKIGEGKIGNLRLGFGGSVVHDILPKIIRHIHCTYPDLKLNLQELTTAQQIDALKNGDIDVGILVPPISEQSINIQEIRKEEFVVCLHKDHPYAQYKEPLSITWFHNENIITTPYNAGSAYYESIMNLCRMGGFFPHINQTAQEQHTIVSLVASQIGVAFVPYSTSKSRHVDVVFRRLKEKVYKETAVAWNDKDSNPSVSLFLSVIEECGLSKFSD